MLTRRFFRFLITLERSIVFEQNLPRRQQANPLRKKNNSLQSQNSKSLQYENLSRGGWLQTF